MAFSATRMMMAAAGVSVTPPFTVYAANNGGTVYLTDTTIPSDSYTGSISLWFNASSFSSSPYLVSNSIGGLYIFTSGTGLTFYISDSGGGNFARGRNTTVTINTNTWYNLLISWDTSSATPIIDMYLNNTSLSPTITGSGSAFQGYYGSHMIIYSAGASSILTGCMSEVWIAAGQFLDFTNSSNRALFYNSGSPVNLGSSGQIPTGTSPSYYWKGQYNNLTNLGSLGGSFTQNGGSLTACSSYPFGVSAAEISSSTVMTIGNSTVSDSSTGILSIWVNFSGFTTPNVVFSNTNGISLQQIGGAFTLNLSNSSDTEAFSATSTSITTGVWYNLLCSWNTNFSSGSKIINMYINGTNALSSTTDGFGAFNCGYNGFPVDIGRASSLSVDGCITQFYFAPGQFLDFTNPSNVALFYNSGSPVNLGSNGQTPTGISPAYFWPGLYTDTTNLGSQGSSWSVGGTALSNCGSTP